MQKTKKIQLEEIAFVKLDKEQLKTVNGGAGTVRLKNDNLTILNAVISEDSLKEDIITTPL